MRLGFRAAWFAAALIAARLDQLPPPQRALIDNAAVLGTGNAIGSLERFAKELDQEFRRGDLDELAADGLIDIEGHWWRFRSAVVREVAYQTLTKRVRGATTCRCRRGGGRARRPDRRSRPPRRDGSRTARRARHVDGVKPTISSMPWRPCWRRRRRASRTGRLETAARHASRALDLHRRGPGVGA